MPIVKQPAALAAAYLAAKKKMHNIPTLLLQPGQTVFRSFNPKSTHTFLPKPLIGKHVSKYQANLLLIPSDGVEDRGNRFSGPSYTPQIPASAGFYTVLQQQALVNELIHYSGRLAASDLSGRSVLKIKLMRSLLVAELSPHNPGAHRFLRELGADTWDRMIDAEDCSVARGIGLAIAEVGFLRGLSVQTVRESERSNAEHGDNLVLFSAPGRAIPGVYIEEASYFGESYAPEVFPVSFP